MFLFHANSTYTSSLQNLISIKLKMLFCIDFKSCKTDLTLPLAPPLDVVLLLCCVDIAVDVTKITHFSLKHNVKILFHNSVK